jgi:hydrogenase maturation protein HypF
MARRFGRVTQAEADLLQDPAAPVVLIGKGDEVLPDGPAGIAPGQGHLGWMLPYTPLHHLILAAVERPLVMTSGNLSGEPQVIGNDEARDKLGGFADAFVMHDRDIARRLDDSVERANPPMVLRRARGRVPGTLPLPPGFEAVPQVVGYGGQMKAAICLIKNGQALLGHHLGELDEALTYDAFVQADADYAALFDHKPQVVACDLHPDFRASVYARQRAADQDVPLIEVQHHHAHLASCLAENLWPMDGVPVVGIVLDGTGLGPDGTIWGGEVLLGDYRGYQRLAWLRPAPLIGGDRAGREPWRNALVRLDQVEGEGADWVSQHLSHHPVDLARQAAAKGINAPLASSAGRLFDAVAAILGLCRDAQTYEGEAAMRLEALARGAAMDLGGFAVRTVDACGEGGIPGAEIDPAPVIAAILAAQRQDRDVGHIAAGFHRALARAFADQAARIAKASGARAIALSGGCFQNLRLVQEVELALSDYAPNLTILRHQVTPANDGGLALGQAVIAASRAIGGDPQS